MKFTLTVKIWQKERPEAANGVGVAKAITKVETTCAKDPAQMDNSELDAAYGALSELEIALQKGEKAIKGDGKNKDRTKILNLLKTWFGEITKAHNELEGFRYKIRVSKVQKQFNENYGMYEEKFLKSYPLAQIAYTQFINLNAPKSPEPANVQKWMGQARDMAAYCSKTAITLLPEGKQVNVQDIEWPGSMNDTKSKVAELLEWCTKMAEGLKVAAKGSAEGLNANVPVEKELKEIIGMFEKISSDSEPLIAESNKLSTYCKNAATKVKVEVEKGDQKNGTLLKQLAGAAVELTKQIKNNNEAMITLHSTHRIRQGELFQRVAKFRLDPSFDENKYGSKISKISNSCQTSIRLITLPLVEGLRQIERIKRMLKDAGLLGHADQIPTIKLTEG